ncbi:MAG: DUF885 domain-containing protein [Acidobacteriota bacterium]|nr:DUF885 domain-containing protein [Acidobacteriota bacterium]
MLRRVRGRLARTVTIAATLATCAAPLPAHSQKSSSSPPPKQKTSVFSSLEADYLRTFLERFPVVATYLGAAGLEPAYAALDGKLRDYSPGALHAEREEWTGFQARLVKIDMRKLSEPDRIDASVLKAQLAFLVRNLDRRVHEKALDAFLEEPLRGIEFTLQGMAPGASGARGTAAEWRGVAMRAAAVPAYLKTALANVRRGTSGNAIPDRRLITAAVDAAESTAVYFEKSLPEKAVSWGASADTRSALSVGCPAAAAAFRDFRKGLLDLFFETGGKALKPAFDRDRFAVGDAEYSWALQNNLLVVRSPRDLHADGKAAVAATLGEMTALARRIAADHGFPDPSLGAVLTALGDDIPKTDDEMLSWYRGACRRLVDYGRKTGMFDLPADYKLDVVFTPAPLQATIDAAYYPAPQFREDGIGQFYVTPTGNDPAALREHARAAIASLAAHEGFPGHDWYYQFGRAHAAAIPKIRWLTPGGVEDSASMWGDAMSSEGWALYCERLVGEPRPDFPGGFYTPEERLFQLQNQLLRDARVVVDTGIHCGFMSFEDAVNYFSRNVAFVKGPVSADPASNPDAAERAAVASVRREIFRYSKWPTQAVTYFLGKAEILELREECRKIEGPSFSEKRFHEEFLLEGQIPPGLFRARLLAKARARTGATGAPGATEVGISR